MNSFKYYKKLYFTSMSRSMIARMEYKNDLIIGIFGFFIQNVATLLSLYFIIRNIPALDGWNMYQMGFFYGFTMMLSLTRRWRRAERLTVTMMPKVCVPSP